MNNSSEGDFLASFFNEPCPTTIVCLIEVTIVIAVTFGILVGNVANLVVLLSTPSLRNCHGCMLLSLSIADLITGAVASLAIYPSAVRQANLESWPYGDTMCLITAYLTQVGITTSCLTLTLLAIERYIAVVHPLWYSTIVTKKHTFLGIAITWFIPASAYASIFVGFPEHFYFPTLFVCLPMFFDNSILAVMIVVALLPGTLIVMVTSLIVSRRLKTIISGRDSIVLNNQSKLKIKTFRMVQIMTLTFVICYIPCFVVLLVSVLLRELLPQVLVFFLYWLLLANSFFNSLVYFVMNKTFRGRMDELVESLRIVSCVNRARDTSSTKTPSCQSRSVVYSNRAFIEGGDLQTSNLPSTEGH